MEIEFGWHHCWLTYNTTKREYVMIETELHSLHSVRILVVLLQQFRSALSTFWGFYSNILEALTYTALFWLKSILRDVITSDSLKYRWKNGKDGRTGDGITQTTFGGGPSRMFLAAGTAISAGRQWRTAYSTDVCGVSGSMFSSVWHSVVLKCQTTRHPFITLHYF